MGSNPNALPQMYVRGVRVSAPSTRHRHLPRNTHKDDPNLRSSRSTATVSMEDLTSTSGTIETYTILKDAAAATAMYGSRAASSVVVITTNPACRTPERQLRRQLLDQHPRLSSYNLNIRKLREAERLTEGYYDTLDDPGQIATKTRGYNGKLQNIRRRHQGPTGSHCRCVRRSADIRSPSPVARCIPLAST